MGISTPHSLPAHCRSDHSLVAFNCRVVSYISDWILGSFNVQMDIVANLPLAFLLDPLESPTHLESPDCIEVQVRYDHLKCVQCSENYNTVARGCTQGERLWIVMDTREPEVMRSNAMRTWC